MKRAQDNMAFMQKIYFDYAATAPTDPHVIEAMTPFLFEKFGNASSPHTIGREAQKALEESRETIARFIGASADETIFNSGATEGNNHVMSGLRSLRDKGHIIVSSIEHHSVLEPIELLRQEGWSVTYLKVSADGLIDPQTVRMAITNKTALIAVLHASNEIGTIQPIAEIGRIAQEHKIPFLVDAVQTIGHIPVNVNELNADFISLSAHKFYGPKGVGVLYVGSGAAFSPLIFGGSQERGRRAGTENVPGIVGLGVASELAQKNLPEESKRLRKLQTDFESKIRSLVSGITVSGGLAERLPNTSHLRFQGLESETLLIALDQREVYASSGSACMSGSRQPSHVLKAMGCTDGEASSAVRFSFGRHTTEEEIHILVEELGRLVPRLRASEPAHSHSSEEITKGAAF